MINVFVLHNGRLSQIHIESREDLENTLPIWVDLTDPNEEERECHQQYEFHFTHAGLLDFVFIAIAIQPTIAANNNMLTTSKGNTNPPSP